MIVKPICAAYDVNRKFGFNATEAITIEHEEDFKTRFIDLFLYENNVKNAVDVSGATVTARMVTTPEFDSLLLNDNVSCSIGEKQGHIVVPIDKAVLPSYPCEFLIEIHIENGEDVLVLPFPLWVKMNASILDDAGVTPESKGTVPELLEEATQALEAAEEAIAESKNYNNLENKPSINGVTLSGNKTSEDLHIEAGGTDDYEDLENKPKINNVILVGNKTADDLNLQEKMISDADPYIYISQGNRIQFSDGLVLKAISNLPEISHGIANAFFEVDEAYLNFHRQYLPQGCTVGLYLRILREGIGTVVIDYYFDHNGNIYYCTAEYQGTWIISDWTKLSGITIQSATVNANGTITFTMTDGSTITTTGISVIGPQGEQGIQGIQGVSIVDVDVNFNNHLIVTLSDGTIIDAGEIGQSTIDISDAVITLNQNSYTYDGSSHVPNVTSVTLNGQVLTLGVDYAVVSIPATNAGDYVITISGMGDYSGTATANWTISKAQSTISGDDSILIRGIGDAVSKTYTTNGDGTFSFTVNGTAIIIDSSTGGNVVIQSEEIGDAQLIVSVSEGLNYLGATKTVNVTVAEPLTYTVFGVMWDYSLSSPELTRLTPESDPLGVVTTVPEQEPTACIGTEGGQSDFDNYNPWASIMRFNYVNGQIVDFVDYNNGETYVYIPEFWSKIVDDSVNQKMYFYVSDSELNGFTKHLGSGRYIGRYACDLNFVSKSNGEPKHRISMSNFRTGVTALDNKHYLIDIHSFSAIQLLYIIEFANLNSQSKIGEGLTNVSQIQNLGLTDALIYHTGRTAGVNDQSAVHYRWIENLWGNVSEYVDGILTSGTKVYFCDDYTHYDNVINSFYYDTNLELPNLNNEFVKTENCFNNGYLLPKTIGASSTTYTCDRIFLALGTRVMRVGGIFNSTNAAGIFAVSYSDSPTDTPTNCCGRPILILNTGGNS